MKKHLFIFALIASVLGVQAQDQDPTVMKINGKDIKKSEFEYIYNKNNTETAIDKKTLDEYVELFKNFKLRVAEAETQGMDTTESFRKEFNEYRNILAKPYLDNLEKDNELLRKEYGLQSELFEFSHIYIAFPETEGAARGQFFPTDTVEAYKKALLVRSKLSKGTKIEDLVREYSDDPQAATMEKPGYVGWYPTDRLHASFIRAMANTKAKQLSQPVRLGNGYHLFYVINKMTNPGTVNAAHILVMAQEGSDVVLLDDAKKKADSLYLALKNGADFAALASEHSEDPGSAANGGELGWFGKNQMVPEFDETVFGMVNPGEISKPIKTRFGYHIIKLIGKQAFPDFDESMSENITSLLKRKGEGNKLLAPAVERIKRENGYSLNDQVYKKLLVTAETVFPNDSIYYKMYENDSDVLFSLDNQSYKVSDLISYIKKNAGSNSYLSTEYLNEKYDSFLFQQLMATEDKNLEKKHPEFKHLVQEYRDGILLFEVSNKEVWERSSMDTDGLTAFFAENKGKYTWDQPRYKGYVVFAKDSKTKKKMQKGIKKMKPEEAAAFLLENYKVGDVSYVRLEKGLYVKGDNPYVDELVFKGNKAEKELPTGFEDYFVVGTLLNQPEAYTDVRGLVITDYQDYLEKAWLKELNNKYPVVIYEDVLKTVK
ncbi:peptidylprolyl isomerase [Bacteroidales bacterium OttesenSCG-928-J19]|nr:peptidylprolyl isomerase [Bacteroidales bacterium OttesenSCG-928-J19]